MPREYITSSVPRSAARPSTSFSTANAARWPLQPGNGPSTETPAVEEHAHRVHMALQLWVQFREVRTGAAEKKKSGALLVS